MSPGTRFQAAESEHVTASEAAALRVAEFSGTHAARILDALRQRGKLTVDGIARATRIPAHAVGKRLSELERNGLARPARQDGEAALETQPGRSGRQQRVWEIA